MTGRLTRRRGNVAWAIAALLSVLAWEGFVLADDPAPKPVDFAHDILPIIKLRCAKCHTAGTYKGKVSFDTRTALLDTKGAVSGKSGESALIERIGSTNPEERMPPTGDPLSAAEIALFRRWIDEGLTWQEGFTFAKQKYTPPMMLRKPELPPIVEGRAHPLDRLIDAYFAGRKIERPARLGDAAFLRKASLDLIGLLPTHAETESFLADPDPAKHEKLVQSLLARDVDYAYHWLTFWNDHLRNDYEGPGYIDGGRKQISNWLGEALLTNKPYDQMTKELISPSGASEGFIFGIKWRGTVNASQVRELQFAQNVGQVFLGVNLKCASCHDSFIDEWKLDDAYGLAAVVSDRPLEIHRCDKPTGKMATAGFLFPDLGKIPSGAGKAERLAKLAELITQPSNGRFARTIVNRLWHRTMGRGLVYPVDVMSNEPWSENVLDFLAAHHVENHYDLKATLALICTSTAYRSESIRIKADIPSTGFVYQGPVAKRLTAEQFLDAVRQLTGVWPAKGDVSFVAAKKGTGKPADAAKNKGKSVPLGGNWIWNIKTAASAAPGNESLTFKGVVSLAEKPRSANVYITCDNEYTLFVNGEQVGHDDDWETTETISLTAKLQQGENEFLVIAKNHTASANPAGLYFLLDGETADGKPIRLVSDSAWKVSREIPTGGKFKVAPSDWKPAEILINPSVWSDPLANVTGGTVVAGKMPPATPRVRAALVKSDPIMRSLGRPNREQVVTTRPDDLSTLQALDLANDATLYQLLNQGAANLKREIREPAAQVDWVYRGALCREPNAEERSVALDLIGSPATEEGLVDLMWSVLMLPEFQLIR